MSLNKIEGDKVSLHRERPSVFKNVSTRKHEVKMQANYLTFNLCWSCNAIKQQTAFTEICSDLYSKACVCTMTDGCACMRHCRPVHIHFKKNTNRSKHLRLLLYFRRVRKDLIIEEMPIKQIKSFNPQ